MTKEKIVVKLKIKDNKKKRVVAVKQTEKIERKEEDPPKKNEKKQIKNPLIFLGLLFVVASWLCLFLFPRIIFSGPRNLFSLIEVQAPDIKYRDFKKKRENKKRRPNL